VPKEAGVGVVRASVVFRDLGEGTTQSVELSGSRRFGV